jgi:membrane protein
MDPLQRTFRTAREIGDLRVNPVERGLRTVDAWQQRHRVPGFAFAVFKKFGDDQAGNLVALLTYFAFVATFPLLLALTGILGLVLKGDPALQARIQTSALSEFPIIGTQLRSQIGVASLGHSTPILIFGIVGAIFGGRGLANALQNTLNSVWNVPKVIRPGFPSNSLRTIGLLGLLGVGAISSAAAASLAGAGQVMGLSGIPMKMLGFALATAVDILLFFTAFRMATAKIVAAKDLLLGAILSSIAWQILASVAGVVIGRNLKHAQAIAGFFGVVLGLLAWFGLQAAATVYAMEADVVRARHLWPRSITQPPLTAADKRFIEAATRSETRRPEQKVTVEFTAEADRDPRHPPDVFVTENQPQQKLPPPN